MTIDELIEKLNEIKGPLSKADLVKDVYTPKEGMITDVGIIPYIDEGIENFIIQIYSEENVKPD